MIPTSTPSALSAARALLRRGLVNTLTTALVPLALVVAAAACPGEEPPPAPEDEVVGRITATLVDGGVELAVDGLVRPIRSLQVDVKLDGANGLVARALNGNDVLEANLDAPRSDFTVVLGDTRRIPLVPGALVRIDTDRGPGEVTLSRALAVDANGARATLAVGGP